MPAPKPTEAQMTRAIEAARRTGCSVVKVKDGAIYFLVNETPEVVTSPEQEEVNPWDAAMGIG